MTVFKLRHDAVDFTFPGVSIIVDFFERTSIKCRYVSIWKSHCAKFGKPYHIDQTLFLCILFQGARCTV